MHGMLRQRPNKETRRNIGQQHYHPGPPAPSVPEGPSQIPEPEKSCRDLVWPRQTTPLADGAASIGQEGERLSDPPSRATLIQKSACLISVRPEPWLRWSAGRTQTPQTCAEDRHPQRFCESGGIRPGYLQPN